MQTIGKSQIQGHLTELASGGEGVVYLIANRPTDVYKEYKPVVRSYLNIPALRNLVAIPDQMSDTERQFLMSRTAWPHTLVTTGAMTHGFLMEKVPNHFMRTYGLRSLPKNVLCEWTYLIYQDQKLPPSMTSDVPEVALPQKIALIKDLAAIMNLLHRHGVIIGDISGRNLLWTTKPEQILIIDCDSFRIDGQPGTTEPKESPHFTDPHKPTDQPTDLTTDIYKLGIATYRAIWHDAQGEPTPQQLRQTRPADVPDGLVSLIERSIGPRPRPPITEWVAGLSDLFKFGKRPVLRTVDATGPIPLPPNGHHTSVPTPPISSTPPAPAPPAQRDRPIIPTL